MFSSRTSWSLAPNRFSAALATQRASRRELLDLTESNPTRVGLEYDPQLLETLASWSAFAYKPDPKGLIQAREAVAVYYRERGADPAPSAERILLTSSTSEAYSYVFRLLCDPADEVLVPAPSYPLFEMLASVQDVHLVHYPLLYDHGWHIDLPSLAAALTPRSRAIMVVHPNNPTGSFVKPEESEKLAELCRERDLALVADEVFLDYAHDGRARPGVASSSRALTFTLSGLSKISALPQMKLAWLVVSGPEEQVAPAMERLEIISDTYLSVSTPVQLAAPALLAARHTIQPQITSLIGGNLLELGRQLQQHPACSRLDLEGGWYAVLRVPVTGSDEELAISLLEKQSIIVHPGHFYDFPGDGYLVLSLIVPAEIFAEGVGRLLRSC